MTTSPGLPRRSLARAVLERMWGRTRVYRVFRHDPSRGWGQRDDAVCEYDVAAPPPTEVVEAYRRHAGRAGAGVMLGRLAHGRATMLTIFDGGEMLAYGWLQAWDAVQREFWWLGARGLALGPYWTNAQHRGLGLYGRLLAHSVASRKGAPDTPLFIWARAENAPSIAGILRTGLFHDLGRHRVHVAWFGFSRRHAALTD